MTGAVGYSIIEYLFRGYTHWSMVLTGGACLLAFYFYTEEFKETPTLAKAAVGALIFTVFEFAVGLVVNVWFQWDVWSYSRQIGNVLGQICPKYTLAWFIICLTLLSTWELIGAVLKAVCRTGGDGEQGGDVFKGEPPLDQNRKVL